MQFKGAYRKLLVHNEVMIGKAANCSNDITQVLEVSSRKKQEAPSACPAELQMLSDFDLGRETDDQENELIQNSDVLQRNSTAYVASILEERVIRKIIQKGRRGCLECANTFVENEITDDMFISFKSKTTNVIPPCQNTIDLIKKVDSLLRIYESQDVTLNSMLAHILGKINLTEYYTKSIFGNEHDHKNEFISFVIKTYLDLKSTDMCKFITRMSQDKQIRHTLLKEIHREGQ